MKITEFALYVAEREKGSRQVDISQIKQILKIVNDLLGGELYKIIRKK